MEYQSINYKNQNENNSPNILQDRNNQASFLKFSQIIDQQSSVLHKNILNHTTECKSIITLKQKMLLETL